MSDEQKVDYNLIPINFEDYILDETIVIDESQEEIYYNALDEYFKFITPIEKRHNRGFSIDDKKITFILCKLYKIPIVDGKFRDQEKDGNFISIKINNILKLMKLKPTKINEDLYKEYKKYILGCKKDKKTNIFDKNITEEIIQDYLRNKKIIELLHTHFSELIIDENALKFILCILILYNINFRNIDEHIQFLNWILPLCTYNNYLIKTYPKTTIFQMLGLAKYKYLKYKLKYIRLKHNIE
jgi:hypothetical protein